MNKQMAYYKISLISIAFVLLLFLSTASADTAESVLPTITETRITTNTADQCYPAIYGNKIVWEDYRNGYADIYMYDISTSKETQITTNESNQKFPAIYEDRIVWTDERNSSFNPPTEIYMYDLSTSSESLIKAGEYPPYFINPVIYGDKIVWEGYLDDYSEISMYDLSTKKETQIITGSNAAGPAIYGNRIVYNAKANGYRNADIYMYDVSTKKEKRITADESYQSQPAIYKDKIVWWDTRNENYDIYMYDLSTSKETRITTNTAYQCYPAIYGDKIVWLDDRNGNPDIYMYDLSNKKETRITTSGSADNPRIYGNNIVWEDHRNGNLDIYMCILSNEKTNLPVAAFSAKPTLGKAPLTVAFTDKSTEIPTKWKWSFGDGTTSTKQNPKHKYSKTGSYTVKLTATNAEGSNTVTKTNYIKVVTKPIAAFSAKPTSGKAPLTVAFTDESTGIPTKWKWNFGDGKTSTQKNPKHQYLQEGNYKVTLTATNAAGSSTATKTNYVKVTTNTRPGVHSEINP